MGMTRRTFSLAALASGSFIGKRGIAGSEKDPTADGTQSGAKEKPVSVKDVKNLVFRGGGPLALSYVGAMEVLQEKGLLAGVERTTGSSAGALFATLAALNLTPKEMREFMFSIKNPPMDWHSEIKIPKNLLNHYGMLSTDYIIEPLEKLLEEKTGNKRITFTQLQQMGKFKQLYVVATDLSTSSSLTFSHENKELDIPIAKAVSASNALPLAYKSVNLNIKGRNHVLVDGGIMRNYPIEEFDLPVYCDKHAAEKPGRPGKRVNPSTLGFFSDSSNPTTPPDIDERPYHGIDGLFSFLKIIPTSMFAVQGNMLIDNQADAKRTVFIENPSYDQSKGYEQTPEVKEQMVANGRAGTLDYLKLEQHQV